MFQWYYGLLSLSDLYDVKLGRGLEYSLLVYIPGTTMIFSLIITLCFSNMIILISF